MLNLCPGPAHYGAEAVSEAPLSAPGQHPVPGWERTAWKGRSGSQEHGACHGLPSECQWGWINPAAAPWHNQLAFMTQPLCTQAKTTSLPPHPGWKGFHSSDGGAQTLLETQGLPPSLASTASTHQPRGSSLHSRLPPGLDFRSFWSPQPLLRSCPKSFCRSRLRPRSPFGSGAFRLFDMKPIYTSSAEVTASASSSAPRRQHELTEWGALKWSQKLGSSLHQPTGPFAEGNPGHGPSGWPGKNQE